MKQILLLDITLLKLQIAYGTPRGKMLVLLATSLREPEAPHGTPRHRMPWGCHGLGHLLGGGKSGSIRRVAQGKSNSLLGLPYATLVLTAHS